MPSSARTSRPVSRTPRLGTVLFGLVLLGVATGVLYTGLSDRPVDWTAVAPYAVLGAGVLLALVGVLGSLLRRR